MCVPVMHEDKRMQHTDTEATRKGRRSFFVLIATALGARIVPGSAADRLPQGPARLTVRDGWLLQQDDR